MYSGDVNNMKDALFLGDVIMDMFSLTHGPTKHIIDLSHSQYKFTLNFTFESIQKAYTSFKLDNIIIPTITDSNPCLTYSLSGRKISKTITAFNYYNAEQLISENNPILEVPFMYADVINPSLTLTFKLSSQGSDIGYCSFGIAALYKRKIDEPVILEGNIRGNNNKIYPIQAKLTITNFPRSCVTPGTHIYCDKKHAYKDLVIQEGSSQLSEKTDAPFMYSCLYCDPPVDPQLLKKPFILEVNCIFYILFNS